MLGEKFLGWNLCETKSLLCYIIENKNKPFSQNFALWAKRNGRGAYSVRNYFYKILPILKQNSNVIKLLELNENDLAILLRSSHFCEDEEILLLKNILSLSQKMSVRMACLKIADGDKNLMIRNQNKFRKLLKTKKELVKKVMEELKNEKIEFKNPYEEKILKMPSKKFLSKEDVNSLFLGLLKLVREEVKEELKESVDEEKIKFIKRIREQRVKEMALEKENKQLKDIIFQVQTELGAGFKSKKMQKLKSFIDNIKKQKETIDEQKR